MAKSTTDAHEKSAENDGVETSNVDSKMPGKMDSAEGYFFTWRVAGTRLFNNMAIALKSQDEADEYMRAIAEQFRVAMDLANIGVKLEQVRSGGSIGVNLSYKKGQLK